jgi:RNA polymerase sigma-70 factor, ECF subfamily
VALVRRCLGGDRSAFDELVRRYERPVYNAAVRILHDADEAHDVAQTAFLKAYEHLGSFDTAARFYSWLYRIAINEALNAQERRRPSEQSPDETADGAPGPEAEAAGEDTRREIEAALMSLTPELRAVVVLRHTLQLSYEDMAETLHIPGKTVKSRLYSARQLLRERLLARGVL